MDQVPLEKRKEVQAKNIGCLLLLVLFIVGTVITVNKSSTESNPVVTEAANSTPISTDLTITKNVDYEDGIYQLNKITGTMDRAKYRKSKESILEEVKIFNSAAASISDVTSKADSTKKIFKKLTAELKKIQLVDFPVLRKNYARFAAEKLWEENITVTASGPGNNTINFVGGLFANNKNIKQVEETIGDVFNTLRFKKATYRWYKGADEFTYYKIESKEDSEISPD